MISEYNKQNLDNKTKKLYDNIVNTLRNGGETIACSGYTPANIYDAYVAVNLDHIYLFFISQSPNIIQHSSFYGKINTTLTVRKIYSNKDIKLYNDILENIKGEIVSLTDGIKDIEHKLKIVCDYIIERCVYEIDNVYNQNIASVLIKGKGQCSGIAKATKFLLDCINIPSCVVSGSADDDVSGTCGPHAWNIVNVNDEHYHLDVTFMLGANLSKNKPYRYKYFNYTDEKIAENHTWDRTKYPKCIKKWNDSSTNQCSEKRNDNAVNSLYEFRVALKKAINNNENNLVLLSNIKAETRESLMRLVTETIRNIANQNCCKITSWTCSLDGKVIHVTLNYRV